MGWMNDTLKYIRRPPVYRQFHHNELTFSMMYAFAERFVLPLSHDEVVHGKKSLIDQMPGDVWQKFANLRLLYGYMWTHPGKKTLFMGSEFGQWLEWNCEQPLQWQLLEEAFSGHPFHRGLQALVRDLNALYCRQSCLHRFDFRGEGFQWIDCHNRQQSTLSYFRGPFGGEQLVIACNFTPAVHRNFRLGLPRDGTYSEILNSDSAVYGGSDVVNQPKKAEALMQHGQPFSMSIVLPPLAMCVWQRSAHTSGGSDPTESSNRTELLSPSE
jgi:1,4-alpha-glucan branching enzyme